MEESVDNEEEYQAEDDQDTPSTVHMDYRIIWIRNRVLTFLGLTGQKHLFDELINANDRYFEDKLLNFLILDLYEITTLEQKLIFFYKTYVDEVYQDEVSKWEEKKVEKHIDNGKKRHKKLPKRLKRIKDKSDKADINSISSRMTVKSDITQSSSVQEFSDEDNEEEEECDDHTELNGSGDFIAYSKEKEPSKNASKDSLSFVPPPGEEDKYVLTKKMIKKIRKLPVLHMICGEIDSSRTDLQDVTLFYFMRSNEEGIPSYDTYEECLDDITDYIIVGSLNGKFLISLNRILIDVFKPLVENQFRGPDFAEQWQIEKSNGIDVHSMEKATFALANVEARSSVLRRPSEFRRASALIARQDIKRNRNIEETDTISGFSSQDEDAGDQRLKSSLRESGKRLFTPDSKSSRSASVKEVKRQQPMIEHSKKDILDYLNNFIECVEWTLEHVEGDILLTMPKISELNDPAITDDMLCQNKDIVEQIEQVVASWEKHTEKVLMSYVNKVPLGKGPLAEHGYWHDCETGLSMLVEQLKMPIVERILAILEKAQSPNITGFGYFQTELWKHYVEARDNNKILQTLSRYFKLITESDSFETITECLPSLTEGLRMLWILSSYYSSEDKIMRLLDRISWQLCETIRKHLAIVLLFKKPLNEILEMTSSASVMLKQWKLSYLQTREDIELSGKGARWEFDQKRLFENTEYIAGVCNDLNKIANVLQDFYNIFGHELKSIINDPAQIDAVIKRVDALIVPIEQADFDIYNVFNKANWEAMIAWFYQEVVFLEDQAKFYIDECFMVLISAENALKMLLRFKEIKTRASIQQQLLRKFDVIMQQFSKEINIAEDVYHRGKRFPPLLTYHPPMAGAIFWVRQLFHRLRRPVLIFQDIKDLKHSELKLVAFSQYLDLAKQMKEYEEFKFNTWLERALVIVTGTMKKSVLRMIRVERESATLTFPDEHQISQRDLQIVNVVQKLRDKDVGSTLTIPAESCLIKHDAVVSKRNMELGSSSVAVTSKIVSQSRNPETRIGSKVSSSIKAHRTADKQDTRAITTWSEFMSGTILGECQLRFQLNFNWEVFEVIREAELMEHLGFELPTTLRDIGVQKNRLRLDIDATKKMIDQYNNIMDTLDKADIQLLKRALQDIEKQIQPGIMRFNWNSLSISDYALSCGKMLKYMNSIVDQVMQMKRELDKRIESELQSYHLFSMKKEIAESEDFLPCKTYFLEMKNRRTELVSSMSKIYQSISPMIMKLESLVLATSTGKNPGMQLLYEKYEKKIFASLITCMVRNMEVLNKILNGTKPIFQVDAVLIASEVVLRPSPSEIYSIICHDVCDLLERLKGFSRWMNGTCLECKLQKRDLHEEPVPFSFFEDVMSVRVINDLVKIVQETAHRLSSECSQYLYRWKKYSNLWSYDKNPISEKFAATRPTLMQYDEKFTFYGSVLEELADMSPHFDINSIRINVKPLLADIEHHTKEWKQILGNYLLSDTVQAMNELKTKIETFRGETELVITGLDRFTLVIQAIADVRKMAIQAEVQFLSYQECFRTMRGHAIAFPTSDETMAYDLQHDWESLYLGAFYRASTLESTYDRFREMTEDQIDKFLDEIDLFANDFETNGPGSFGDNFELGLKKMDEYGKLIDKHEEKRLNLMQSEILFDLPPADYSVFLRIKKEYEGMEILYKFYKQQSSARETWATTLWVNLNPQQLIDGMEHFMKEFRKLPKFVRVMNLGHALEADMRNFKSSVPLFIELKNEAMRDRHWQELMRRTGQYFDMDPDRCEDDQ